MSTDGCVLRHLDSWLAQEISKLPGKTQITGPVGYSGLSDPKRKISFFQQYLQSYVSEIDNH